MTTTDATTKQVFTTGEAAELCNVSQQTIIRCFDQGRLDGFRVPGSRFRRIPRASLLKFMQDNGIPAVALEAARCNVLVISDDLDCVDALRSIVNDRPGMPEHRLRAVIRNWSFSSPNCPACRLKRPNRSSMNRTTTDRS